MGVTLGLGIGLPAAVLILCGLLFGVMYDRRKKPKETATDGVSNDTAAEAEWTGADEVAEAAGDKEQSEAAEADAAVSESTDKE